MSDFIKRQNVIDAIANVDMQMYEGNAAVGRRLYLTPEEILAIIEALPSAEPELKKGRWQRRKGSDCWECSQCHAVLENDDLGMHNFYFCYHCGANMMNKSGYMDLEKANYE